MSAAQQKAPSGQAGGGLLNNHRPTPSKPQGRAFPPYSNQARQRLHPSMANRVPGFGTLFIHAGANAWYWGSDNRAFLLSPADQDPAAHDWSVCALATPPVLLIDRGATDDHLERVAMACLRDGARRVLFLGIKDAPGIPMWEARS